MLQNIHGNIKMNIFFLMFHITYLTYLIDISKYRLSCTISYHILLKYVYTSKTNKIHICNKTILTFYNYINAGI